MHKNNKANNSGMLDPLKLTPLAGVVKITKTIKQIVMYKGKK